MITNNLFNMSPLIFVLTLMCFSNGVVFGRYVKDTGPENSPNVCQPYPNCNSKIFCVGKIGNTTTLLHDVQMSGKYHDSTAFLKLRLKNSEPEILKMYNNKTVNSSDHVQLKKFIDKFIEDNFIDETLDKNFTLRDFNETAPPFLKTVKQDEFIAWLKDLNELWRNFSRKMPDYLKDEEENPDENRRSSYIYVPNPFIVAGGRFDEMYYWDSYWIIKGLLACGMTETSKGIIENMIYLVKKFGYVPNGNRIYYLNRSQPPMLIQMVDTYYKHTNDDSIIKNNLTELKTEFDWWWANRRVEWKSDTNDTNSKTYNLFRYHAIGCAPRPEAYKEDYKLLNEHFSEDSELATALYTGIRSAAESGWDFSSRHMRNPKNSEKNETGLRDMFPGEFAYVELCSILYSNALLLANWTGKFGNKKDSERYAEKAASILDAIENILWNDEVGIWLDFDLITGESRKYFYPSNFAPLWSKAYKNNASKVELAVKYLKDHHMMYPNSSSEYYGLPTTDSSMINSTQQWDFPNVWAPLQSFVIGGLQESNNKEAQKFAFNLATSFVGTAYQAYLDSGPTKKNESMYEKYNATTYGGKGQKGEYPCQTGFGWTNGLVFELFNIWPCFPITFNTNTMNNQIPDHINCTKSHPQI